MAMSALTTVRARLRGPAHELAALAAELRRLPSERRVSRPQPPDTGLVVDLGAGHAPDPRADVVIDKYVADDFERGSALTMAKPLIVGDGQAIPLADGAASYLIAAHVLEHATDPVLMASEISRVARAGFVQTPSRLAEAAFGWAFHPWLIDREGDTLAFHPKPPVPDLGASLHDVYGSSALFRLFFFSHRSELHHTLHWQGRIDVRVDGTSRAAQTAQFDLESTLATLASFSTPPLDPALRAALRCPGCGGALADASAALRCADCARSYPVVGNVPVLLTEAAAD